MSGEILVHTLDEDMYSFVLVGLAITAFVFLYIPK